MFRHVVLLAFCFLSTLPGVSQTSTGQLTSIPENDADSRARAVPPGAQSEARISVSRLQVPRKARQLYEKAYTAWARHPSSDDQHNPDRALKICPNFPEALTLRGGIQAFNHQWESAEQSLKASIQSDPGYTPAYIILAGVYNTQDRYGDAQQVIEQAVAIGTTNWSLQYEIARVLIGKKQFENALLLTDSALHSNRGPLMHLARAHALLGLRRYPQAEAELRTYLHDDPSGVGNDDARHLLDRIESIVTR